MLNLTLINQHIKSLLYSTTGKMDTIDFDYVEKPHKINEISLTDIAVFEKFIAAKYGSHAIIKQREWLSINNYPGVQPF